MRDFEADFYLLDFTMKLCPEGVAYDVEDAEDCTVEDPRRDGSSRKRKKCEYVDLALLKYGNSILKKAFLLFLSLLRLESLCTGTFCEEGQRFRLIEERIVGSLLFVRVFPGQREASSAHCADRAVSCYE